MTDLAACQTFVATENGVIVAFFLGGVAAAWIGILGSILISWRRNRDRAKWHRDSAQHYDELARRPRVLCTVEENYRRIA